MKRLSVLNVLGTGLLSLVSLVPAFGFTTTNTWTGNGTGSAWGTGANWSSGSGVSLGTELAIFKGDAANSKLTIDIGGTNRNTAGLQFNAAAGANGFTFNGPTATIAIQIRPDGIVNNDTDTQTINTRVKMFTAAGGSGGNSIINAAAGDIVLNGNSNGSNDTGGYTVDINGTGTLTIDGAFNTTIGTGAAGGGGVIMSTSSTGNIIKNGAGTLILGGTAANTYTGTTAINAGTVRMNKAQALGTGAVTVNAATLEINNVSVIANNLTLNNGATLRGTGTASFSKSNFPAVSGAANASVTLATGSLTSDVLTIGAAIRGGSATSLITVAGDGTVIIGSGATAATAYAGSWDINGTSNTILRLTNADALGNPGGTSNVLTSQRPIKITKGTLDLASSADGTFSTAATIAGDVGIKVSRNAAGGANTQTLGIMTMGTNTLTVSHGTNYNANFTGNLAIGATTLTGNPTFTLNNTNGTAIGTTTLGAINDGGTARTISKGGNGTMTLGTAATSLVDGTTVNVTGGTLNSNNATALGSQAKVALSTGATLGVGASQTLGALNGATGSSVKIGANALTVGSTNNLDSLFDGGITDGGAGGSLVKAGTGVMTLNGANVYSGGTTVNDGTLSVNGSVAGDVVVNGGKLGGNGTIAGSVTMNGGEVGPGNSIGTINTGSLALNVGSYDFEFSFGGGTIGDNAVVPGADLWNVAGQFDILNAVSLVGTDLGTIAAIATTKFTVFTYTTAATPAATNFRFGNALLDDSLVTLDGVDFIINYDDVVSGQKAVTLTVPAAVPEASTFVGFGIGLVFAVGAVWMGQRMGVNVLKA